MAGLPEEGTIGISPSTGQQFIVQQGQIVPYQAPAQSGFSDFLSALGDFGSGVVRGGAQTAGLAGDLVLKSPMLSPVVGEIERQAGMPFPSMQGGMEEALNQIGLPREDSLAQRVGEFALPVGPQAKGLQVLSGMLAGGANYGAEKLFPNSPTAQIAATLAAGSLPTAPSLLKTISPGAKDLARIVTKDVRGVVPNALTDTATMGERAEATAKAVEQYGKTAEKAGGQLFEALPKNQEVNLDQAIERITSFAKDKGAPLGPDGKVGRLIGLLKSFGKPAQQIDVPPSVILDKTGKPAVEATTKILPAVPAKKPLNEIQNLLRDIGDMKGADKVDNLILNEAKKEVLKAAKINLVPDAYEALEKARSVWRGVAERYQEGAAGEARKALKNPKGKLESLQRLLLGDPKSSRQLVKAMGEEEIKNSQGLVFEKMFQSSPENWSKFTVDKRDNFINLFGEDTTNKLTKMFSSQGTVGKRLLQDPNALDRMASVTILRSGMVGGGTWLLSNPALAIATGGAELARLVRKGKAITGAKEIIMQAAAGVPEAVEILSKPATEVNYPVMLKALETALKEGNQDGL